MHPRTAGLRRAWRRLRRRARRSRWLSGPHILAVVVVLIVGLPIILPLVAFLHARDQRRRRRAARASACVQCGVILGDAALALADARWMEHVERLHREHPGYKFRLVRDLHAVCTGCGALYRYDKKGCTFRPTRIAAAPDDR